MPQGLPCQSRSGRVGTEGCIQERSLALFVRLPASASVEMGGEVVREVEKIRTFALGGSEAPTVSRTFDKGMKKPGYLPGFFFRYASRRSITNWLIWVSSSATLIFTARCRSAGSRIVVVLNSKAILLSVGAGLGPAVTGSANARSGR